MGEGLYGDVFGDRDKSGYDKLSQNLPMAELGQHGHFWILGFHPDQVFWENFRSIEKFFGSCFYAV